MPDAGSPRFSLTSAEQAVIDRIDAQGASMIETVKTWSAINSGSFNAAGVEAMRAKIEEAFGDLGGQIEAVPLEPLERVRIDGEVEQVPLTPAVRVTKRADAPVRVALTGHHDTVFPADDAFQSVRQIDEDTLGGPGVADMKGGLIVMREALAAFERSPNADKLGWQVLISPDEEIGSHGSGPHLAALGRRSHLGMTYEPALADGSLAGARKGSGNFTLIAHGKTAHAGREHHLGRNALVAAAWFANALDDLNGAREGVTFNVAKIDGGGPLNAVPDLGVCRFNVRMPHEDDMAWAHSEIERLVAETGARDGIEARLHGGFTRPPKPMHPKNEAVFGLVRAAGELIGVDVKWNDTGGVCEGNNLWAAGCPNVDTLGVRGGAIHSHDEFVRLSSFVERARLSAVMLMKIASGEFDAVRVRGAF